LEKFSGNFFFEKETRRKMRREFLLFDQFLAPNFARIRAHLCRFDAFSGRFACNFIFHHLRFFVAHAQEGEIFPQKFAEISPEIFL